MTQSVVIIQARTNSSRLPAKVLLPINGIPVVVLAAKRAANTGKKVIVATSDESSDDVLFELLASSDIECYRGSLDNTLERIVKALSAFDDKTIVFRLTADNVFPDGILLDELQNEFLAKKLEYLCCNGEASGLPYGMSAEVTYLKCLRTAHVKTSNQYDLEHVTPYIRRTSGENYFEKYKFLNKGNYRCTIDTLDDYLNIQRIFKNFKDPVNIDTTSLIDKLDILDTMPISSVPMRQLVLGGAQLGLNYGITNKIGQPDISQSKQLIESAINNGVEYIDTASAYGASESVIGEILRHGLESRINVITKLSPLTECPKNADFATIKSFVESSIYQSCVNLNRSKLDCLMLHRVSHTNEWGGAVWKILLQFYNEGILLSLGASVQSPDELIQALAKPEISYIQLPFNILDTRWDNTIQEILKIKTERKLIIHVRSTLLQGILLSNDIKLWERANCNNSEHVIDWLKNIMSLYNRKNILDTCISYVRSQNWVDAIVLGMETIQQFNENIETFSQQTFNSNQLKYIDASKPILNEYTLNPSKWKV